MIRSAHFSTCTERALRLILQRTPHSIRRMLRTSFDFTHDRSNDRERSRTVSTRKKNSLHIAVTCTERAKRVEVLPAEDQNTKTFSLLTFICKKQILKERRYFLSVDAVIKQLKQNPILQARNIEEMKKLSPGYSNSKIARELGLSRVRITQLLNLLKLDQQIQEKILRSEIIFTERQLRPLTHLQDQTQQRLLFEKMSRLCVKKD
jgi:hypothetical protein